MTFEFDTNGGAEGMTDAITIRDGEHLVAVIDLANFGQEHCEYLPDEATARRIFPIAFEYAEKICREE